MNISNGGSEFFAKKIMGKYFGTDGVRGEANVELTPELAFKLGRFGGYVLSQHETGRPKVFVARDTRISGEMLESALVAGLLSVGIEVYKLGVLATPGVSYLVRTEKASAGVMISASHNPAKDNGIKFFGGDGFKLADDQELEIEGLNINDGVGSTHPEQLQELVKESGAAVGLAFDGDSDRLIAVDENGEIVDGDKVMYIIGKYLSERGQLAHNTIVTTVMSNLGFHKALDREGINKAITAVGDRYVVEEMRKSGYNLGGEQSGHVIIMDYNTTGDGQLTGIQLVKVMKETGKPLSELAAEVTIYPQKLVNVRVENSMKSKAMEVPAIAEIISKMEEEMNGNGRILVRPSGTEPLLRVMAEAPTDEEVSYYVDTIADVVRKEIGID